MNRRVIDGKVYEWKEPHEYTTEEQEEMAKALQEAKVSGHDIFGGI